METVNDYEVTLNEVISHTIKVRAENQREAIETAKKLIANEPDDVLKKKYSYSVDTVEWGNYEEADEVL